MNNLRRGLDHLLIWWLMHVMLRVSWITFSQLTAGARGQLAPAWVLFDFISLAVMGYLTWAVFLVTGSGTPGRAGSRRLARVAAIGLVGSFLVAGATGWSLMLWPDAAGSYVAYEVITAFQPLLTLLIWGGVLFFLSGVASAGQQAHLVTACRVTFVLLTLLMLASLGQSGMEVHQALLFARPDSSDVAVLLMSEQWKLADLATRTTQGLLACVSGVALLLTVWRFRRYTRQAD